MDLKIIFPDLTPQEWHERLRRVSRSTLLQSYPYAKAIRISRNLNTQWALILVDGEEVGLCQIHEGSVLWGVFHVVTLDRGPLWYDDVGRIKEIHWENFAKNLNELYPKRFGRSRRFLPETSEKTSLRLPGFTKKELPPYQTVWLDLDKSLEDIRANFHQKWRNALNKAEKQNIKIEIDPLGKHISWMLKRYIDDRIEKKYPGPSPKFLANLLTYCAQSDELFILRALDSDHTPIAAITILKHGRSATYQIGWSNEEGRQKNAMNLLLWGAITHLKKDKMTALDLGGINDDAPGLRKFKEGMGGETLRYIGHFA